jgi:hypothetical protein
MITTLCCVKSQRARRIAMVRQGIRVNTCHVISLKLLQYDVIAPVRMSVNQAVALKRIALTPFYRCVIQAFTELSPSNAPIQPAILPLHACPETSVAQQFLHVVNTPQYYGSNQFNPYSFIHDWLCQLSLGPWPLLQFCNIFSHTRYTPWTSDKSVVMPLPTHRIT